MFVRPAEYGAAMSTIVRGNSAEAAVRQAFIDAGLGVLVPFGDGYSFDLAVVLPDERLLRVQVKSSRVRNGCVQFNTCSTDHGRGRQTYDGRADLIAVHAPTVERIFVVPVE